MSSKADRTNAFLKLNPLCCFCGGPSEETEHLPSRACFDNKGWPEGFEFPTCRACNASTSQDEQVVALISRMLSNPHTPAAAGDIEKYVKGVSNNNEAAFNELASGIQHLPNDMGVVEVGLAVSACFDAVLPRWARAFHYKETGIIIPGDAWVRTFWLTNHHAVSGEIPPEIFDAPDMPIRRGGKDLSSQFGYMPRVQPDGQVGIYVVVFRRSFAAWMGVDLTGQMKSDETRTSTIGGG